MESVVAGAAIMPSRLLAIGAAATGLAGILVGTLVSAWMRNREEVEKWNKAVRESDFGTLRTEAAKTAAEIGVLTEGLERLRRARDQGVTPQATAPRGATAPLTPGIP